MGLVPGRVQCNISWSFTTKPDHSTKMHYGSLNLENVHSLLDEELNQVNPWFHRSSARLHHLLALNSEGLGPRAQHFWLVVLILLPVVEVLWRLASLQRLLPH